MCNDCDYTIHSVHHHFGWDNSFEPAMTISPGATVEFETIESSNGQLNPHSTVKDVIHTDFDHLNPVTGPIYIDGAEPGDSLKVTIEYFKPQAQADGKGWGWTANIPGFGLLADQFKEPALINWSFDCDSMSPAMWSGLGRIPLKPFAGTIGNAMAELGLHSVVPPRSMGGNLDIRDLAAGTTLYLPVEVDGALFSVGDTHAVQGDGEVCGTAIESPMNVTLTFDLVKGENLKTPRFTTSGSSSSHFDSKGYEATTGVGPDLMQASKDALSNMIDLLCKTRKISAVDAYMLCSVCGNLRISEIVDIPNWVVSFYFPRCVFE